MAEKQTKAQQNEERIKNREQIKQQNAENPNALYWLPFSGRHGYTVAKTLRDIDRDYNRIIRSSGYGIPIENVQSLQSEIRDFATRIWNLVTEHIPRLHTVQVEKSYMLNNDLNERRQKAKIYASIFFLPRSTELAWIGMAVKQIEETGEIMQSTDLDGLKRLTRECYDVVNKELTELAEKLSKMTPPRRKPAAESR